MTVQRNFNEYKIINIKFIYYKPHNMNISLTAARII